MCQSQLRYSIFVNLPILFGAKLSDQAGISNCVEWRQFKAQQTLKVPMAYDRYGRIARVELPAGIRVEQSHR
jgi:hypothetical protein